MPVTITYEINERVKKELVIARVDDCLCRTPEAHTYGVINYDERYLNSMTGKKRRLIAVDWDKPDATFTHGYGDGLGVLTVRALRALGEA